MGKAEVVVDTNVPLVANGKAEQAGWKCVAACVRKLIQVQAERRTLVDDKQLIFKEYRRKTQPLRPARAGRRVLQVAVGEPGQPATLPHRARNRP